MNNSYGYKDFEKYFGDAPVLDILAINPTELLIYVADTSIFLYLEPLYYYEFKYADIGELYKAYMFLMKALICLTGFTKLNKLAPLSFSNNLSVTFSKNNLFDKRELGNYYIDRIFPYDIFPHNDAKSNKKVEAEKLMRNIVNIFLDINLQELKVIKRPFEESVIIYLTGEDAQTAFFTIIRLSIESMKNLEFETSFYRTGAYKGLKLGYRKRFNLVRNHHSEMEMDC